MDMKTAVVWCMMCSKNDQYLYVTYWELCIKADAEISFSIEGNAFKDTVS